LDDYFNLCFDSKELNITREPIFNDIYNISLAEYNTIGTSNLQIQDLNTIIKLDPNNNNQIIDIANPFYSNPYEGSTKDY
jgi:hypothetical protein